ncbi:caspase family protein [Rhizobium wenxiniae]|uniref:caspase family protein n=1 Tax=Rhizobium wenxiniae TaxID=1737357 RepID=UPI001C6E61A1|nr:caspase family protein [Rhizobium wenxiniae]MBW9090813.1 caspase family protein [Rhizobium wenxiniae]
MRKALIVGIDYYDGGGNLYGCVNDAYGVKSALERNSDGTLNFDVMMLTGTGPNEQVTRGELREKIKELFAHSGEIALLYFAGHGHIAETGGYLIASDSRSGDDGIPLSDLLVWANESAASNKVIILDSCHSGVAGERPGKQAIAELSDGLTILTASTAEQYASEKDGAGVFTTLLIDALNGAAANLVGEITPGSIYAHIDQSLGSWAQRPVFKTNVKRFISLKKVQPPITLADLQRLTEIFPEATYEVQLDPSFEPDSSAPDPEKAEIFAVLQNYNRVNLVLPVGETHMYYAAMNSKSCKLTVLGEHYRRLVENKRI